MTYRTLTSDSSSIASVAYSPARRTLDIQFRNGAVYRYFDVPAHTHDALLEASSKGRYFHQSVRGSYAYEQLSLS